MLYIYISIYNDYDVGGFSSYKAKPSPSPLSRLLVFVPYPGEAPFDPRQGTGRVGGGIARQGSR